MAEAMMEKAEKDRAVEVGKIQVALDERASKVESLKIQLQMSEGQAVAAEECIQIVEAKRASVERDRATFRDVWKAWIEEVASLQRDVAKLESQVREAEARA